MYKCAGASGEPDPVFPAGVTDLATFGQESSYVYVNETHVVRKSDSATLVQEVA